MRTVNFDLQRMITLRVDGWSYSALGREFQKDHTTIMYHCRRLGLSGAPLRKVKVPEIFSLVVKRPPSQPPKYALLLETPLNPGKTYKEYLEEALRRPIERRYHKIYYETNLSPGDSRRKPRPS